MTVIAFTRPKRRLPESIVSAEAAGFTVMAAPSLEIVPSDIGEIERLLRSIRSNDVVVFTSATAAEECGRSPIFADSLRDAEVISIGPGTAYALQNLGVSTDIMPTEYSSEGIVEHMNGRLTGKRIILIRSDRGSHILDRGLRDMGAEVVDFTAYSLQPEDPKQLIEILDAGSKGKVDVFAFTSPLSAQYFVDAAKNRSIDAAEMMNKATVAAIGRPTADMLASLDIKVDVIPEKATFEGMILAVKKKMESGFRNN